ncbi:MAG: hypothetical protein HYS71_03295 [Candidatus Omnitrophica bacterium]|nr:hypothetical protein [Candidatus Omnitrophota bacterium]
MPLAAVLLVWLLSWPGVAHAASSSWERIEVGSGERAFVAVAVDPTSPELIVTASRHALYESSDGGRRWRATFRAPGVATISALAVESAHAVILVGTDRGLFASFDGGAKWSRVFRGANEREAQCTAVAFHPLQHGTALLGTRGGVFISSDRGRHWKNVRIPHAARDVAHFAFDPHALDRLYLLAAEGLFIGSVSRGQWEQRFRLAQAEAVDPDAPSEADVQEDAEQEHPEHRLSAVALDPQHPLTLYVAGTRGLQLSVDGGTSWRQVARIGLESQRIVRLLPYQRSPLALYAATSRGVARYDPAQERWDVTTKGLSTAPTNDLAASADRLWAATDEGLYRAEVVPDLFSENEPPSARELLANFTYEPTMADVREAAIRYAEVHPDKIRWWRRQAALRAFFPAVEIGVDHDRTRRASIDEGTFPRFQIIETDNRDAGLNLSVKWELGDLLWNDDQTSIDVRSKLMVQLRNDIVDEVTRIYFERRRLQVALLTDPPSDQQAVLEKELRIQELTALIDGLTGGYFSHEAALYGTQ